MKKKNRAMLRGEPLDRDCYLCRTTTGEYGKDDNRVFCYGLVNRKTDEHLCKCKECGAFVGNETPLKENNNG